MSLIEYEDLDEFEQVTQTVDHVEEILSILGIYDPPMADTGWHAQAACRPVDGQLVTSLFFPEDVDGSGRAKTHNGYREGRRICQGCPVREECADAGKRERWGLWGGLSENERHPKRRK